MLWLLLGLAVLFGPLALFLLALAAIQVHLRRHYLQFVVRVFQERPLFVVPRGQPTLDAEEVRFSNGHGHRLAGCYFRTNRPRRGVILFGLEFTSNRWSCPQYCEALMEAGYDVFSFEPRNQGDSDSDPTYHPLQWATNRDVDDMRSAIKYLTARPDADPRGIGLFGISKGASAGLVAAADDPRVLCCVTDGAFAVYTTMVPYMRKWFAIYNTNYIMHGLLPSSYYGLVAMAGVRRIERELGVRFPSVERALRRLSPRPWLQIHGGADSYIKPPMARTLAQKALTIQELWMVPGAKHNQAMAVAGEEYRRRLVEFFDKHLGAEPAAVSVPEPESPPTLAAAVTTN